MTRAFRPPSPGVALARALPAIVAEIQASGDNGLREYLLAAAGAIDRRRHSRERRTDVEHGQGVARQYQEDQSRPARRDH